LVLGEQARLDVPVRTDERQCARFVVQSAGSSPNRRIGIEEPILVQNQGL
jgi:hypothetical protein